VGAEAASEEIYAQAEEGNWDKAQWCVKYSDQRRNLDESHGFCECSNVRRFKLHLRSKIGPRAGKEVSDEIPPLPLNKTVVEVFADFLAYLFKCASSYIQETHANGATLWASVKDEIHFVLSHPNGWEGAEQSEMRKAAVRARFIPDTSAGYARLSFVTEGEASLHFAIQNGLPEGVMKVKISNLSVRCQSKLSGMLHRMVTVWQLLMREEALSISVRTAGAYLYRRPHLKK
jgi:hypothetical protein